MHNHTYKWQLEPVPLRKQPHPALGSGGSRYVLSPPKSPESHSLLFPGPQGAVLCSGHLRAPLHSASARRCQQALGGAEDSEVMVYFSHLLLAQAGDGAPPQLALPRAPSCKAPALSQLSEHLPASGVVKASVLSPWVPQQPGLP